MKKMFFENFLSHSLDILTSCYLHKSNNRLQKTKEINLKIEKLNFKGTGKLSSLGNALRE